MARFKWSDAYSWNIRDVIDPAGRLSTVSLDKSMRTWNSDLSGATVLRLETGEGKRGGLVACAKNRNGDLVALATAYSPADRGEQEKAKIFLVQLPTYTIVRSWSAHSSDISHIEFSNDGRSLLSTSFDGTAGVWNVETGERKYLLSGHSLPLTGGAFSTDGLIATVSRDRRCIVWRDGKQVANFVAHDDIVSSVVWSNERLLTGGVDRYLKLWTAEGKLISAKATNSVVRKIVPADSREEFFCTLGGYHNGVQETSQVVRYAPSLQRVSPWFASDDEISSLAIGSQTAFLGDAVGRLCEVSLTTGKVVSKKDPENLPIYRVSAKQTGYLLRYGTKWNLKPSEIPLDRGLLTVNAVVTETKPQFTDREGRRIGTIEIGKTSDQRVGIKSLSGNKYLNIPSQDFSTTIYTVGLLSEVEALVSTDKGLYLFDVKSGEKIKELSGHSSMVTDISISEGRNYFVTSSSDQTIVFWNYRTKLPFMRFFASGDDWVMWNPSGQYASSPDGERLIAWQVNRGPNEFGDILPAIRFRDQLYRPDVIRDTLANPNLSSNNNLLNPGSGAITLLPPDVKILSPKNGEVSKSGTIVIEAIAKPRGNNSVSWVELRHNSCTAKDVNGVNRKFGTEGKDLKASWEVKLEAGVDNTFSVVAFSKGSGTESVSLPVRVKMAQEPHVESSGFRNLYIISIGISHYKDQKKLAFAKQDAERIAKKIELRANGLFEKTQTKILLDEDVNDKSIQEAFLEVRQSQSVKDLAIVFFAGHGASDKDGDYNFLYHDCPKDTARLQQFGFSVAEFEKEIKDLCPVVLLLDTCSAGELTTDASRIFAKKSNVMTFVSSDRQEAALENSSIGMSNFAYSISAALDGRAELRPLGSRKALFAQPFVKFVRNEVEVQSQETQHPRMVWGEFQGRDFAFSLFGN